MTPFALGSCRVHVGLPSVIDCAYLVHYPDEIAQMIRLICGETVVPPEWYHIVVNGEVYDQRRRITVSIQTAYGSMWQAASTVIVEVSSLQYRRIDDSRFPDGLFTSPNLPAPDCVRLGHYTEQEFAAAMDRLILLCGNRDVLLIPHFQHPAIESRRILREWLKHAAERHGKRFWDQSVLADSTPPDKLYADPYHYTEIGIQQVRIALTSLLK